MTTQDIAKRLVELCRHGDFETAQKELFTNDAISIEPYATKDFAKETKGLDAIFEKGQKFMEKTEELFSTTISEPLVTARSIAFILTMDIKMKDSERMKVSELCVYQLKDGKIISEQFFM